jgi:mannose-6-phosphate isomerase-like protein (cupin superfamily)
MKKPLLLASVLSSLVLAYAVGRAQEAGPFADASSVFAQLPGNSNGYVSQQIMHAPAGDVLATYIGRTPLQVYSKQDELVIVISGSGTAHVGYPSYNVKPGSVVSIPRNTAFQITATSRTPIKAYIIATPYDDPNSKRILEQ